MRGQACTLFLFLAVAFPVAAQNPPGQLSVAESDKTSSAPDVPSISRNVVLPAATTPVRRLRLNQPLGQPQEKINQQRFERARPPRGLWVVVSLIVIGSALGVYEANLHRSKF